MTKNKEFKKERKQKIENKILKEIREVVPSYNPKYYAHFDRPISFQNITNKLISGNSKSLKLTDESKTKISKKINKLKKKLNNKTEIAEHAFYPFIGFEIIERRVSIKRKIEYYETILPTLTGKDKKKCQANLDKLRKNNIIKSRPIRYSSHSDGCIYAFYSKKIYDDYEKKVEEYDVNDEVLAYRVLPPLYINDEEMKPNNCTMAKAIFEEVKRRNNKCYALAFDISGFFDCIDHEKLYKEWANVLNKPIIPTDHLNLFRSLTKYSYVDLKEVCFYFNGHKASRCKIEACLECKKRLTKQIPKCLFNEPSEFREFRNWYKQEYAETPHKKFYLNEGALADEPYGIPQGTAMSALLSNIYMLPFDVKMKQLADSIGGIYRRYCDDIMFICPPMKKNKKLIIKEIKKAIEERGKYLKIHPIDDWDKYSKSQCYDFTDLDKIKIQPLQYLGFYFDGEKVRIREGSLARYMRKSKRAVTASKLNAIKKLENMYKKGLKIEDKHKKLYRKTLYEKYTYRGKRNFISYAYASFKNFDDETIKKQVRNHTTRLIKLIKQADNDVKEACFQLLEKPNQNIIK